MKLPQDSNEMLITKTINSIDFATIEGIEMWLKFIEDNRSLYKDIYKVENNTNINNRILESIQTFDFLNIEGIKEYIKYENFIQRKGFSILGMKNKTWEVIQQQSHNYEIINNHEGTIQYFKWRNFLEDVVSKFDKLIIDTILDKNFFNIIYTFNFKTLEGVKKYCEWQNIVSRNSSTLSCAVLKTKVRELNCIEDYEDIKTSNENTLDERSKLIRSQILIYT